ncbi:hypothetical protein HanHA300_Chr04g0128621 [Helianthus annuus]|nr:hypothetical protein HanHA300_Chr04g0128621 [Helianthus annuus]KAJ0596334.1 hypothetical protein HanHA89_Chr04g0141591 [Helianthus annuus]KAJ0760726.1 hypothetical protein HanOQP8_Chr04g0141301 [Helianthus annuus]
MVPMHGPRQFHQNSVHREMMDLAQVDENFVKDHQLYRLKKTRVFCHAWSAQCQVDR